MPLPDSDGRDADRRPSDEEIKKRKQLRCGLRVERAVNPPGGRPAPTIAPECAEEQS